jgi:hypothetical protein
MSSNQVIKSSNGILIKLVYAPAYILWINLTVSTGKTTCNQCWIQVAEFGSWLFYIIFAVKPGTFFHYYLLIKVKMG